MAGGAGQERIALYKRRGGDYGREARRKQLAAERKDAREQRRTEAFTVNRGIQNNETGAVSREEKYKEWKKKRETNKKKTMSTKPAFIVGKITYNDMHLYKTPESTTFRPPQGVKPVKTPVPERPLRSRTRLQQKGQTQAVKDAIKNFAFGPASFSKKDVKNKVMQTGKEQTKSNDIADVLNRTFDGPQTPSLLDTAMNAESPQLKLEKIVVQVDLKQECGRPLRQRAQMVDQKSPKENIEPEKISTRDKGQKSRAVTRQRDHSKVMVAEPELTTSAEITENFADAKSAEHFRSLYNGAVAKLDDLCNKWKSLETQGLPSNVNDEVDVAVGYAQLLISEKLQQFQNLITEHENTNSSTELKVLSTDLDGFWGLVYNQVEDVYMKFNRLEEMKQNGWQQVNEMSKPVSKAKQKSKVTKFKGNVTSGLRSFIAHARMKPRGNKVEDSNPVVGLFDIEGVTMQKPMSPVVLRIASKAKQIGSPTIDTSLLTEIRSPLRSVNRQGDTNLLQTPTSNKRTPQRRNFTPGSTLRRSTRILSKTSDSYQHRDQE